MKVEIVNRSRHPLPDYSTPLSAGMDIRANLEHPVTIGSGERMMIPTGLYISLPASYEAQIRPRSGLALKYGISVLNSPGTIDADYRGEIGIILINHGQVDFEIRDGDRICQMIISRHEKVEWMETKELEQTDRGSGGFGHTGQ